MGDLGINATTAIIEELKRSSQREQHIKEPEECKRAI